MVGSQLKRFESLVSTEPCHAWRGADILHTTGALRQKPAVSAASASTPTEVPAPVAFDAAVVLRRFPGVLVAPPFVSLRG